MNRDGPESSALAGRTTTIAGRRGWLLLVWLPVAGMLGFLAADLWLSFHQRIRQVEERVLTIARAVEQHAAATIDRADLSVDAIISRLRPEDLRNKSLPTARRQALVDLVTRQHRQTRGVVSISIVDANGLTVANSTGAPPGIDLSDRDYFAILKANRIEGAVISGVVKGKSSNRWGMHVARRIEFADGKFAGVVVANLGLRENFENFYSTLNLGEFALVTLRRQDNTILVRYPVIEAALGKAQTAPSAANSAVVKQMAEGVFRSVSPVDGVDRIVAIRRLSGYPVFAQVGVGYRAVVEEWLIDSTPAFVLGIVMVAMATILWKILKNRIALVHDVELLNARLAAKNRELSVANAQIEQQSFQDQLTGAWNRRFAEVRLREALARSDRDGVDVSLLIMDLDHFKEINDGRGHLVGDAVLTEFVNLVQGRLRVSDVLIRWGGDEFLLLLEGSNLAAAAALAEDLRATLEAHAFGHGGRTTVTVGIAQHRRGEPTDTLLSRADIALYSAKQAGRNRVGQ